MLWVLHAESDCSTAAALSHLSAVGAWLWVLQVFHAEGILDSRGLLMLPNGFSFLTKRDCITTSPLCITWSCGLLLQKLLLMPLPPAHHLTWVLVLAMSTAVLGRNRSADYEEICSCMSTSDPAHWQHMSQWHRPLTMGHAPKPVPLIT